MMRALFTSLALSLAIALASPAWATSPPTIYDNTQSYPLGSRAAGMGGAYTALACDEGALHYNPAALACSGHSRIELAANAYMLQHLESPNALGPGQDITATTYHPLPSIAGFVRLLSPGDAKGVGAIGLGLTVTVPRSVSLSVDPPNPMQKDFFSVSVRDDLLAGDVGVGWQATPDLAIGASIGGALRTYELRSNLLLVRAMATPCGTPGNQCSDFVAGDNATSITSFGARAKVGVRWTPIPMLALGAMFVTPSLDLYGTAHENDSTTVGVSGTDPNTGMAVNAHAAVPFRTTGSSQLGLPARIAIGAALSLPSLLLSVDVSLGLPRTVRVLYNQQVVPINGIMPPDMPPADKTLSLQLQPNVNVGAEIRVSDSVAIDLGAFTDLSATSDNDLSASTADRVHMFGFTAALGILGRQARSYFGASFEIGSGSTRVQSQQLTFDDVLMGNTDTMGASLLRWSIVGIIGSSYSFISDEELPPEKAL
jgi:hypothetical protein